MTPLIARRRAIADEQLVARLRAGDEAAFTEIHDRYRRQLVAYARRFIRDDAEDVVQDVFAAAYRALRADDREIVLRPWLYRLTRNRCIDNVRRAHHADVALADDDHHHDVHADPFAMLTRKEKLRSLVIDIAGLPERQRTALLAREMEDASYDTIATELGITPVAARILVMRARDNLVKSEEIRTADCTEVREALAAAHDRGTRPTELARRHVLGCEACAEYKRGLKRVRVGVKALAPPLGLGPLAVLGGVLGSTGAKTAVVVAVVAGVAATGGVTVLATDTREAGDPAPFALKGLGSANGVGRGDPIPRNTALVTARVRLAANRPRGERRTVTLDCPAGMKLTGMQAPEQKPVEGLRAYGLDGSAIIGHSTRGRLFFSSRPLARDHTMTVGISCRRPGRLGSIAMNPRFAQPGEKQERVCARSAYLMVHPGRLFTGTVFEDQPVAVLRASGSGRWVYVIADNRARGWLKTTALC